MRIQGWWGVALICLGMLDLGCSHPSADCPAKFKTCGSICVDTATDVANCGTCGNACAAGNVCSAGTCAISCQSGLNACGASCRDLQTDEANCGACGKACGPGQACTAGVCACPPGMPSCGPNVLVWSDAQSFYPTAPEAFGAVSLLKGTAIKTTGSTMADFVAAYDAGGFDMVVVDETNYFPTPAFLARLNDWVSCGGRFIVNAFPIIYPTPSAALGNLLGITAANPQCVAAGATASIFPDKTTVDLWGPVASVPSPLAPTAPNLVSPFCGLPYPQYYELTAAAGGAIAGRFNTAGTGPGAIAVTRNGHVVVQAFNPSDYRLADTNGDGIPDIQALYENEIAYMAKQGPAGLTCSGVETFDSGTWPWAPWTIEEGATAGGVLSASCAHDGPQGLFDNPAVAPNYLPWYARTDVTIGAPGDKLSMWINTGTMVAPSSAGRAYMGFGSTATATWALVAAPSTSQFILMNVSSYSGYTNLVAVAQTWTASKWYRLEVDFGSGGQVTGLLFDSDGVTQLNSVTATLTGFAPGGAAVRSFGGFCLDTLKKY